MASGYDIQIITAPSILGLKPTGVERLPQSLLECGLAEELGSAHNVIQVPDLNHLYSDKRDSKTNCLNPEAIKEFSLLLAETVTPVVTQYKFALVLGGDCSILPGIMLALKSIGNYGLIFMDAHADFYEPERSITGEVADMDLALVTGRGPVMLTSINGLKPYVKDEHVIHIGQRDWEETKQYGSQDIRETAITCIDYKSIKKEGAEAAAGAIVNHMQSQPVDGYWIHFDCDVLSDDENPAVDYRIAGGLTFGEAETILRAVLATGNIAGMSITIFNPVLDTTGQIAKNITNCIARAFT